MNGCCKIAKLSCRVFCVDLVKSALGELNINVDNTGNQNEEGEQAQMGEITFIRLNFGMGCFLLKIGRVRSARQGSSGLLFPNPFFRFVVIRLVVIKAWGHKGS